jgi:putative transposase
MPGRNVLLARGEVYHVFNRGIDRRSTHTSRKEYQRAMQLLEYYNFLSPPIRYSRFLYLGVDRRMQILQQMKVKNLKLTNIYAFSFMPNHFHFLLRQNTESGISQFMSLFQNSYTRYFNTVHQRVGPLYLNQFKAVRIETDEQFTHVSRYIHLNPLTAFIVKDINSLAFYPWSSLTQYLKESSEICDITKILSFFKNKEEYIKFIADQADYQRELKKIEHLVLEEV